MNSRMSATARIWDLLPLPLGVLPLRTSSHARGADPDSYRAEVILLVNVPESLAGD